MYYISEYPKDKTFIKVLGLLGLTRIQVALLWYIFPFHASIVWHYTIRVRCDLIESARLFNTASVRHQTLNAITEKVLRGKLVYQWSLTILLNEIGYTGFSFVDLVRLQHPIFPAIFGAVKVTGILQALTASLADICASIALNLILSQNKSDLNFKTTNRMIQKLSVYVVNRGILTTLNARHYVGMDGRKYLSNGLTTMDLPDVDIPLSNDLPLVRRTKPIITVHRAAHQGCTVQDEKGDAECQNCSLKEPGAARLEAAPTSANLTDKGDCKESDDISEIPADS
ncbi:hypothetical protein POSPLADRAFT_1049462 [Postia placenta MAD-698-R-SB12]|uniref:Uncharacterized protein n=1 Tax=Postia placenta MAD-698-R-SB12 TaxID=670580 RepID=A0A1X6MPM5_9APHY|nr:hypothetical protein POSPLADRAFT_1049462 [Postia placenta MAD-698-R-SB12]OSX58219.1 hypothetical protein POSPLADRAFT_1049462 [Postia placenta MAD-698-R-SB12]